MYASNATYYMDGTGDMIESYTQRTYRYNVSNGSSWPLTAVLVWYDPPSSTSASKHLVRGVSR